MKILAIGAHPDDIEIFMFGLLILLKNRGDKIYLAVATDGSLGGVDHENSLIKIRKKESIEGLKELEKPYFFNFPDGKLGYKNSHKVLLHDYIYDIKPDLIITHHKNDYHSDHKALSNIIENIAGHNIPVINCDTMMGLNFDPTYYVDITSVFKLKKVFCKCCVQKTF